MLNSTFLNVNSQTIIVLVGNFETIVSENVTKERQF